MSCQKNCLCSQGLKFSFIENIAISAGEIFGTAICVQTSGIFLAGSRTATNG
jgi:hypothetical protein